MYATTRSFLVFFGLWNTPGPAAREGAVQFRTKDLVYNNSITFFPVVDNPLQCLPSSVLKRLSVYTDVVALLEDGASGAASLV
jgi:hypothetical protein